jgi:hypothetical protein
MIGFIDALCTVLGATGNYDAIVDLQALQLTVTHALEFSAFTSRILATYFVTISVSLQITRGVSLSRPNSFLAIILQMVICLLPGSYPGSPMSQQYFHCSLLIHCRGNVFTK